MLQEALGVLHGEGGEEVVGLRLQALALELQPGDEREGVGVKRLRGKRSDRVDAVTLAHASLEGFVAPPVAPTEYFRS